MRPEPFAADFEVFWRAYPKRVGKLAAQKAYAKVRRGGIPADELLDGVAQYRRTKPDYADWCHPTTWLNQGRWMDEPIRQEPAPWTCPDDPPCPPGTTAFQCNQRAYLEAARKQRAS